MLSKGKQDTTGVTAQYNTIQQVTNVNYRCVSKGSGRY